jgi:ABC-2 type transport system permease protein
MSAADLRTGEPPVPTGPPLRPAFFPRKYFNIFRVSLIERMAYRGDFFLGSILRFLPLITTILLWQAVYAGSGKQQLAGYSFREMIAYLLLVHISRMFSSMPGLAVGIAYDIREGAIKKYLLQPLDLIGYLVSYRIAHKVTYIATSFLPYLCLFWVCAGFFDGWPDGSILLAYAASLLLGFAVGFFFEATIGMVGFWFLEVSSFLYVINTLNFFISGHMFPLDLLDPVWVSLFKCLPFQYLAYFPAAVFLGKIRGAALAQGLLIELAWAVGLILLARWLYRRGLRHYSAFGG